MKIAFIIGDLGDIYKYKYTSKYLPKWLRNGLKDVQLIPASRSREESTVEPLRAWVSENNTIPFMVAVAIYIMYRHPRTIVHCLHHQDVTRKLLNNYDVVYTLYDPVDVFHCGVPPYGTCPQDSSAYERILRATSAFVYPFPNFHNYIINKPYYYSDLRKAGIPIAPYFRAYPDKVVNNITDFKRKITKKGWTGIIVKPSYAGYSAGIQVFKNIKTTKTSTLKRKFKKLADMGFPNVVVQEFIPSFGKNYEIRTYWINEKYAYSVATLKPEATALDVSYTTFKREGGKLDDSVLDAIKPIGVEALKTIRQYETSKGTKLKHPLVRIDFGCCIEQGDCPNSYFINEIETMAAYKLANKTKYPATQRISEALYKFSSSVAKEPQPKARNSKYTATYKTACKN